MTEEIIIIDKYLKSSEKFRLNIGCGANKIEGFLNIDGSELVKPDLIHDLEKAPLPIPDNIVDEIVFFHCIEHIQECFHDAILAEFWRVLKPTGVLKIAYPEFLKCVENYKNNYKGQRDFWKMTIYGRQCHEGDYHITLMDTPFFLNRLRRIGFIVLFEGTEPYPNEYNTILKLAKGQAWKGREELLREEIYNS